MIKMEHGLLWLNRFNYITTISMSRYWIGMENFHFIILLILFSYFLECFYHNNNITYGIEYFKKVYRQIGKVIYIFHKLLLMALLCGVRIKFAFKLFQVNYSYMFQV